MARAFQRMDESTGELEVDSEQLKDITKAMALGFVLEISLCVIAQLSFSNTRAMWITLGVASAIRLFCACGAGCFGEGGACKEFMRASLFFMSIWPFLAYVVCLDWEYVYDCKLDIDETIIRGIMTSKNDSSTVREPKIVCAEPSWAPDGVELELYGYIPVLVQFGVPFLFTSLFLSTANMFQADLARSKTMFQLATLDFLDIANYATLAFTLKGWIWFEANPQWFLAFLTLIVVAWVAAVTEVSAGLLKSLSSKVAKQAHMKWLERASSAEGFSTLALLFIDLPLGATRIYFAYCRVEIDYVFLGKNVLCAIYEMSVLCGCKRVTSHLASLIAMVPGAGDVDAAQEGFEKKILQRRMEEKDGALAEERRNKKELKDSLKAEAEKAINAQKTMSELKDAIGLKVEKLLYLINIIDTVDLSEERSDEADIKRNVKEAFECLDEDKNGSLSATEINERGFSFIGKQDEAVNFMAFVQKNEEKHHKRAFKADSAMDIDKVASYFMKWRRSEDRDMDDSDSDEDDDEGEDHYDEDEEHE